MTKSLVITTVDESRWKDAQEFEAAFARRTNDSGDDWNEWWKEKFDNYDILSGREFQNILETGCGPHTNVRLILPLAKAENVFLEDPLISTYLGFTDEVVARRVDRFHRPLGIKRSAVNNLCRILKDSRYRVDLSAAPLEELPYQDSLMDLVICVNVLDHVMDVERCMNEMNRVLRKGGLLVLGQDLSNEEDYKLCPESWRDIGHPIKVDADTMNRFVSNYERAFYRILPREEGRNPQAHYGTYLFIGQKK